jgi:hypothetical protein
MKAMKRKAGIISLSIGLPIGILFMLISLAIASLGLGGRLLSYVYGYMIFWDPIFLIPLFIYFAVILFYFGRKIPVELFNRNRSHLYSSFLYSLRINGSLFLFISVASILFKVLLVESGVEFLNLFLFYSGIFIITSFLSTFTLSLLSVFIIYKATSPMVSE